MVKSLFAYWVWWTDPTFFVYLILSVLMCLYSFYALCNWSNKCQTVGRCHDCIHPHQGNSQLQAQRRIIAWRIDSVYIHITPILHYLCKKILDFYLGNSENAGSWLETCKCLNVLFQLPVIADPYKKVADQINTFGIYHPPCSYLCECVIHLIEMWPFSF